MLRKVFLAAAAAAFCLLSAGPAAAAVTLQVNGSGQLTGATGVQIGDTLYTVAFQDGTCVGVYGSCDAAHFDFTTQASADAAAAALLDQVFVDGAAGAFDTNAGLTFGCIGSNYCIAIVPYRIGTGVDAGTSFGSAAINGSTGSVYENDPLGSTNGYINFNGVPINTTANTGMVWANFTATGAAPIVAPVPEPATWAMMLLGFGGIGMAMRRSRRNNRALMQVA